MAVSSAPAEIARPSAGAAGWRTAVAIFAVAFLVRAALVFYTGQYRIVSRLEMERAALSLAEHGVLGNPYLIPTGPSAHVAPGYAILLAAIFRVFGTGIPAEIVKQLLACAATGLQYALLPLVAVRLNLSTRAGLLAGAAGALLPLKFETETMGDWEAPFAALALMLLVWRVSVSWSRGFGFREGAIQGGICGVAGLCSPVLLSPAAGLLAAGACVRRWRRLPGYGPYLCAAVLTAAMALAPWGIRNRTQLGEFILTRSNFGLELQLSNNELATPLELENYRRGLYRLYHPLHSQEEALRVRTLGEVRYNRQKARQAAVWIVDHPQRFAVLTAARIRAFWLPPASPLAKQILLAAISLLCLPGWWLLWRKNRVTALLPATVLALFPLAYYVLQSSVRYKYPVDWICLLLASHCLVMLPTFWDFWRATRTGARP